MATSNSKTNTRTKKDSAGAGNKKSTRKTSETTRSKEKDTLRQERQERRERSRLEEPVRIEIIMTITALVSVLLILSYINLCGVVGAVINQLLFGLMGVFTYVFPFVLFFFVAFYLSNRSNRVAKQKLLSGLAFLFLLTGLIQLISGIDENRKFFDYYIHCSENKCGGGIFGAAIAVPLAKLFGTVATAVIIVALMIVFLLLLTGKALFRAISRAWKEKRELQRMREEEYERLQEEKYQNSASQQENYRNSDDNEGKKRRIQMVDVVPLGIHNANEKGRIISENTEKKPKRSFLDELRERSGIKGIETVAEQNGKTEQSRYHQIEMEEVAINTKSKSKTNPNAEEKESYLTELERKFAGKGHTVGEIRAREFEEFQYEQKLPEESASITSFDAIRKERKSASEKHTDKQFSEQTYNENTNRVIEPSEEYTEKYNGVNYDEPMFTEKAVSEEKEFEQAEEFAAMEEKPAVQRSAKTEGTPKEKLSPEEEAAQLDAMSSAMEEQIKKYVFPPLNLLSRPKAGSGNNNSQSEIERNADTLQRTLNSFGVHVKLLNVSCGPAVTRYELQPEQGVKVSSITKLENDIKLNLAAADIRIEAPIPGKAAIGIEVPNKENSAVLIRDLFECKEYTDKDYGVVFAVGKDITGHNIVSDIAKMPHLLIAGATGSGKSVCINTLIMSILYKYNPNDVRMIMIDPKVVELSVYNGIPHLLIPVVTDPKKAAASLNWAVMEMTNRYNKFAELHVRDLKGYNQKMEEEPYRSDPTYQKLPKIVIVVDELADLMMVAPGEVEDAIIRLSQLARAAGMHLIIATQRPSVNVITGLIKANMPSRIAFAVTSQVDSRTILDGAGAEKLLGKGDMLFFPSGYPKPIRVQGAYVSDEEVEAVVSFIKEKNTEAQYNEEVTSHINSVQTSSASAGATAEAAGIGGGRDEYFVEAGRFIIEKDKASIGMLQRVYRIGFNRAARLMEQLADAGVVSEEDGTKPRRILMSQEQFEQYVDENV